MTNHFDFTRICDAFIAHVRKKEVKDRLAMQVITGRIEPILCQELIYFVSNLTNGAVVGLPNVGLAKEQRIDIGFHEKISNQIQIVTMVEVKYVRNRGRLDDKLNGKFDEIYNSMKGLAKQSELKPKKTHGYYKVSDHVTPWVFAITFGGHYYNAKECNKETKAKFVDKIKKSASKCGLCDIDNSEATVVNVFEDHPVDIFGETRLVSLEFGVWRHKSTI